MSDIFEIVDAELSESVTRMTERITVGMSAEGALALPMLMFRLESYLRARAKDWLLGEIGQSE